MTVDGSRAVEAGRPFLLLLEAMPDAVIIVDRAGTILHANRKAGDMFGWPLTDLVGAQVEQLVPPYIAGAHEQFRRRFLEHPEDRPLGIDRELSGMRRDGTLFPLEISLSLFQPDGEALAVASIRDMTRTARFRNAIRREQYGPARVKLGELAIRLANVDQLLEMLPGFIAEALHADVVIVSWVHRSGELRPRAVHGITDAAIASLASAGILPGDASQLIAGKMPWIVDLADGKPGPDTGLARELGLKCGVHIPLAVDDAPIGLLTAYARTANRFADEELYFLQSAGNVAVAAYQRDAIAEKLAHAVRLEAIGQLTGGVAHDFNNILTVVLGNLQMLREALDQEGGALARMAQSAQNAAKRGAMLTNKLLTFSRKQVLSPGAIDLAATLASLSDMLQRTLGEAIRIDWYVAPGCPPCLADPSELDSALLNLALNARDAMPAGGHIHVVAEPVSAAEAIAQGAAHLAAGEYVAISVTDDGLGMTPEVLRHAFEPFFTTKQGGRGSGLGLSTVFGFANQSGGTITIDSTPGTGTEVCMYFPVAPAQSSDAADRAGGMLSAPATARGQTILLVDDDVEMLNFADYCLSNAGYRTILAADRTEALRRLVGTDEIALLFTDVLLGADDTGTALAEEARKIRPGLPILFTSGAARGAAIAADVSPAHFLSKPYERENLLLRIDTLFLLMRAEAILAETRRSSSSANA